MWGRSGAARRAAFDRANQREPIRNLVVHRTLHRQRPCGAVAPLSRRSAPYSERKRGEQHTPAAHCERPPHDAAKKRLFTVSKCELSSAHLSTGRKASTAPSRRFHATPRRLQSASVESSTRFKLAPSNTLPPSLLRGEALGSMRTWHRQLRGDRVGAADGDAITSRLSRALWRKRRGAG